MIKEQGERGEREKAIEAASTDDYLLRITYKKQVNFALNGGGSLLSSAI